MDLDTFDFDILEKMDDAWAEHEWGEIKEIHMSSDMCDRYTKEMAIPIWKFDPQNLRDPTKGGTLYAGKPVVRQPKWASGTIKAVL